MFDRCRMLTAASATALLLVAVSASASSAGHGTGRSGPAAGSARASEHGHAAREQHRKSARFRTSASRTRRSRQLDRTAPDTVIDSGPSGTITTGSASFAFSATEAGSTFECKLDAGAWSGCTSPAAYSGLSDGAHSFSVRARDAAGNTDASPAARSFTVGTSGPVGNPAAYDGAIPGTGEVLRQDLGTSADPIPLWRKIESAYSQQSASNPQIAYHASGGDPRPAIGQSAPTPGYRTLFTTGGMQSLYDAGVGNDSQRTQLISNSDTNTFYPLQPGERYIVYFSVRFEDPAVPSSDSLSEKSQVWQIKNTGSSPLGGTRRMIIAMHETRNNLVLERALGNGSSVLMRHTGFERGEWLRFAADIRFSPDPSQGKLQLWGELTGNPNADLVPLTDLMSVQTAYDAQAVGKMSIGPYHHMAVGGISRDYANVQVTDWVSP